MDIPRKIYAIRHNLVNEGDIMTNSEKELIEAIRNSDDPTQALLTAIAIERKEKTWN